MMFNADRVLEWMEALNSPRTSVDEKEVLKVLISDMDRRCGDTLDAEDMYGRIERLDDLMTQTPNGYWTDRKKNRHKISHMETSYIRNAIAYAKKCNVGDHFKVEELQKELESRNNSVTRNS